MLILLLISAIIGANAQKTYYVDVTNGNDNYYGLNPSANSTVTATYKNITNLANSDISDIQIYPDPVTNILNILYNETGIITIYDMNGILLIKKSNIKQSTSN